MMYSPMLVKRVGRSAFINLAGQINDGKISGPLLGSIFYIGPVGINPINGSGSYDKEIEILLRQAKEITAGPNEVDFSSPPPGFEFPSRVEEEGSIEGETELGLVTPSRVASPPPGFEFISRIEEEGLIEGETELGLVTPARVRRSPRLKEKSEGPYKSMLERAKAVQGYEKEVRQPRTPKIRVKSQKPRPEYLNSMAQLSKTQAEAVLMTAGIDCDETLQAKIKAVLCNNSGGRVFQDSDL